MTITYSSTIPNPPDDPADDVAIMQSNAGAISSFLAIDHTPFNVAGSGQHNRVTFNSNNVPSLPASVPVLFSDSPANHGGIPTYPQLFVYSGTSAQSSDQYKLANSNGSVLLMGGLILKWGSFNITGSTVGVVVFDKAFPNAIFNAQASVQLGTAPLGVLTGVFIGTSVISQSGFNVHVQTSGSGVGYWMALGN